MWALNYASQLPLMALTLSAVRRRRPRCHVENLVGTWSGHREQAALAAPRDRVPISRDGSLRNVHNDHVHGRMSDAEHEFAVTIGSRAPRLRLVSLTLTRSVQTLLQPMPTMSTAVYHDREGADAWLKG